MRFPDAPKQPVEEAKDVDTLVEELVEDDEDDDVDMV